MNIDLLFIKKKKIVYNTEFGKIVNLIPLLALLLLLVLPCRLVVCVCNIFMTFLAFVSI